MVKKKTLSIQVPIKVFEEIEDLVKKGVFSTKNEFVRYSILRTLEDKRKYLQDE